MAVVDEAAVEVRGRWKPYPGYRDSGLDWLGEVPTYWPVRRLNTMASVRASNVDKKSAEDEESVRLCNYTDVYYNECITPDLEFMPATATPEQVRRFSLRQGDVLITKDSESWTDIAVPAVVSEDLPLVLCGYHLALIRPGSACDGAFLARAFAAIGPRYQFHVAAKGITRFGLDSEAIRTSLFAVPPVDEQRAIVAFLDREAARIDALIEKKERLIELLGERLRALISTRFASSARDRDDWVPLKFIAAYREGPGILAVDFRDEGVPLLRIGNLVRGSISLAGCGYLDPDDVQARWDHLRIRSGELLVSGSATSGFPVVVPPEADGAVPYTGLIRVWPRSKALDRDYLRFFLSSDLFDAQVDVLKTGVGIQHWGPSHLAQVRMPLPSLDEQHEAVTLLDRETARIDALVAKVRNHIALLREYRSALVSAAVTGKIDVRDEVAA